LQTYFGRIRAKFEKKIMPIQSLHEKAGEMGFLGIAVPEAYGGLELGFVTLV
jgi:alkylation response protein AidB-like acyl-CoA dehydrogenase